MEWMCRVQSHGACRWDVKRLRGAHATGQGSRCFVPVCFCLRERSMCRVTLCTGVWCEQRVAG